jgi:hypothetical protein
MQLRFRIEQQEKKWDITPEERNQKHLRRLVELFAQKDWSGATSYMNEHKGLDFKDLIHFSRSELKEKPWSEKATLLHILAYYGLENIVAGAQETATYSALIERIISAEADINAVGDGDRTVIMSAIAQDNKVLFDSLVKRDHINVKYYSQVNEPGEACALAIALTQKNDHYLQNLSEREDIEIDYRTVKFAIESKNPNASSIFLNFHLVSQIKVTRMKEDAKRKDLRISALEEQLQSAQKAEPLYEDQNEEKDSSTLRIARN